MSMKIAVIGSFQFCLGFRAAGLNEVYPAKGKEFEEKLLSAFERDDVGIIVVEEELLDDLSWKAKRVVEEKTFPVLVPVPFSSTKRKENIDELIKRALGFEIKQ